ncbi:C-3',4' desaturase CrtD [Synechococcus elongatus]|uniref:C-3',4' desaturase CrtD n=1 Tax=Synechococcus elongatus TaxID=32046 RepID=UPI000F7E95FD|nr:C-3',4' desaturase CrtD [Synechococcus elongatus]
MPVEPPSVAVIGAGIGGLTAAALLAARGFTVTVYEQAAIAGGCASTFRRRGFTFDVGATQVAGLEPGGIHAQIFAELGLELPAAKICDPACAVWLPGESEPVRVWQDRDRWKAERERWFPGSELFWSLMQQLFQLGWQFQQRQPVLPPRNLWDLQQLIGAVRPETLLTAPYALLTVGQVLNLLGLAGDRRLKTFLDIQLKLYSQCGADETAVLYAATALALSQAPYGLYHLEGSMQVLSDRLLEGLEKHGGQIRYRQRVEAIETVGDRVRGIRVRDQRTQSVEAIAADHVVANVTAADLLRLLGSAVETLPALQGYQQRLAKTPTPSGAFVLYLGVDAAALPTDCPPHLQFLFDPAGPLGENNSLFVSVSRPNDGRAPAGQATIVASTFTDLDRWSQTEDYAALKQDYTETMLARLGQYFDLRPEHLRHVEAGTPRTFARYTDRDRGSVGGLGMRVSTFGPFGFANRTPVKNLWLVGDSTHPGEGTAGVSYSAQTVMRQILAQHPEVQPAKTRQPEPAGSLQR